jgi:dTDP-glucose 4,6-dehydratase
MKVLLTGGAGFMGSAVARQLVEEGHNVTVLDALTYAGSEAYLRGVDARFVHGDVCDPTIVAALVAGVDTVVHMAAETHVERSLVDAAPFVRTNIEGTRVVLDACSRAAISRAASRASVRLIHVSTDEVFGAAQIDVAFREHDPHAPGNPYAVTKSAAEGLIRVWERCYGFTASIVRCVNNYGPRQHEEKAVAGWVRRAVAGQPLPVHGAGLAVRDWLHVEDFARGMARVVAYEGPRTLFHLAGQCHRTNLEMASQIADLCGNTSVQCVDDRPGQDSRYALHDAQTRIDLGWQPEVALDDGLRRLIAEARLR